MITSLAGGQPLGTVCPGWIKYAPCRAIACVLASEVTDNHGSNRDSCMTGTGMVRELEGAFSVKGENRKEFDQFRGG